MSDFAFQVNLLISHFLRLFNYIEINHILMKRGNVKADKSMTKKTVVDGKMYMLDK